MGDTNSVSHGAVCGSVASCPGSTLVHHHSSALINAWRILLGLQEAICFTSVLD
jgi:hypothetical protein